MLSQTCRAIEVKYTQNVMLLLPSPTHLCVNIANFLAATNVKIRKTRKFTQNCRTCDLPLKAHFLENYFLSTSSAYPEFRLILLTFAGIETVNFD